MKTKRKEVIQLPREVHTAGTFQPLRVVSLHSECGDIKDGIAFDFVGGGCWIVDPADLQIILEQHRR